MKNKYFGLVSVCLLRTGVDKERTGVDLTMQSSSQQHREQV